jgi:hypothetical protein
MLCDMHLPLDKETRDNTFLCFPVGCILIFGKVTNWLCGVPNEFVFPSLGFACATVMDLLRLALRQSTSPKGEAGC